MIDRIPFFLTWELEHDLIDGVLAQYVEELHGLFFRWLERPHGNDFCAREVVRSRYTSLPEPSRLRFLTAPSVVALLENRNALPPPAATGFFTSCLCAEEVRLDPTRRPPAPVWTALGDAYFAPVANEPAATQVVRSGWDAGRDFREPSADGIVVETLGALPEVVPLPTSAGYSLHSSTELQFLVPRLSRCLATIETVHAVTSVVVRRALKVIQVRKDEMDSHGFSSSSWPRMTGLAALVNAHRADIDDAWITDALVHESIHALLNMTELRAPLYRSQAAARQYQAVSPWSGRLLKMHSFVHACFVWFGLWCFWSLAAESGKVEESIAAPFRSRAHQGFARRDVLDALGDGRKFLADEAVGAIDSMQQIVALAS